MKQVRIATTLKCNLNCEYCIMRRDSEVLKTFTPIYVTHLLDKLKEYDVVCVTGGEPTLEIPFLFALPGYTKWGAKTYLYTNSFKLEQVLASDWDGINIGYHGQELDWEVLETVADITNVRLFVEKEKLTLALRWKCWINGIKIKAWKMDECDTPEEDRFLLVS